MVVFTCNNCGDSLQKPKVQKHYLTVCRTAKNLTCVDCLKDFRGEEYGAHNKCITEQERYAAKGTVTNVVGKGEAKQQQWTDMIDEIIQSHPDVKGPQKLIFEIMSNQTANVPRKKMKFLNFIKNAGGSKTMYPDIEKVWDLIEQHKSKQNNTDDTKGEDSQMEENVKKPKKNKKAKTEENEITNEAESENVEPSKKKKRKSKNVETDVAESINNNSEVQKEEVNNSHEKKSKSKKRKSDDLHQEISNVEGTTGATEANESGDKTEEKKKKKKSKSKPNDSITTETGAAELNVNNSDEQNEQVNNSTEKKGKSKKRKSESNLENESPNDVTITENDISNEIGDKSNEKKKRKKSKSNQNDTITNGNDEDSENKSKKKKLSDISPADMNGHQNTDLNGSISKEKKKKKSKVSHESSDNTNGDSLKTDANVENDKDATLTEDGNTGDAIIRIVLKVLQKKDNLSLTKLQKKVIDEYCKETGGTENPKLAKKFNKQLKKMKGIEILDDNVRLKKLDE